MQTLLNKKKAFRIVQILLLFALALMTIAPVQAAEHQVPSKPVATTSDAEVVILYVGPELKECTGVGPWQCMQVRSDPSEPWQNFYSSIEGFTHESGYIYELRVLKEQVPNPNADGSSMRYTLLEILNRVHVGEEITLYVGPYLQECTGVGPWQCMQVRSDPSEPWGNFYSSIEGFTHESGYTYELRVLKEQVPNPNADASSVRYTLLEILSRVYVGEVVTLYVGPYLQECQAVGPWQCMQVRSDPSEPWGNFYPSIEGFTHESGYTYELRVRKEQVPNPNADASSVRYTLLDMVTRTYVGEEITLYVGPQLQACTGLVPQQCLQVREDLNDPWGNFYNNIEGFEHESGYTYELRVSKEPISNQAADRSSHRYILLEIVSKVAMEEPAPPPSTTLYIASYKTMCSFAFFRAPCLLVRTGANSEWFQLSERLEGFTYMPGYRYEILVNKIPLDTSTCADDCPHFRWIFLQEVNKELALSLDGDNDFDQLNDIAEDRDRDGNPYNDDTDGDGTPDFLDDDDDGDGIPTKDEASDPNGDSQPDDARDLDGDGVPDYLDSDQLGLITIVKDTQPDHRANFRFVGALGNFRLDDPAVDDGDAHGASATFALPAGTYTVTEIINRYWALTALSCEAESLNPSESVDQLPHYPVAYSLPLHLSAQAHITCTFVSERAGIIKVQSFNDRNQNGRKNRRDSGVANVSYTVYNSSGNAVATKSTNRKGRANFYSLPADTYTVCEELPAGKQSTLPQQLNAQYQQPCHVFALGTAQQARLFFGLANAGAVQSAALEALQDGVILEPLPDLFDDDDGYADDRTAGDEEVEFVINEIYFPVVQR